MRIKTVLLLIFILVLAGCGGCYYYFRVLPMAASEAESNKALSIVSDAREDAQNAAERFAATTPALVIASNPAMGKQASVIVEGLPASEDTQPLLEVFKAHGVRTVFFAEGQNAQDEPETVTSIAEAGQELGNYTYTGVAVFDMVPFETKLEQLCLTQKIISTIIEDKPSLFCAPQVRVSPEFLQVLQSCGLEYAVVANVFVTPGMLSSQAEADAFAASIPQGAIISIRVAEPVLWNPSETMAPAYAKEAKRRLAQVPVTVPANQKAAISIAEETELLLTALEKQGRAFVPVRNMRVFNFIPAPVSMEGAVKADG